MVFYRWGGGRGEGWSYLEEFEHNQYFYDVFLVQEKLKANKMNLVKGGEGN